MSDNAREAYMREHAEAKFEDWIGQIRMNIRVRLHCSGCPIEEAIERTRALMSRENEAAEVPEGDPSIGALRELSDRVFAEAVERETRWFRGLPPGHITRLEELPRTEEGRELLERLAQLARQIEEPDA